MALPPPGRACKAWLFSRTTPFFFISWMWCWHSWGKWHGNFFKFKESFEILVLPCWQDSSGIDSLLAWSYSSGCTHCPECDALLELGIMLQSDNGLNSNLQISSRSQFVPQIQISHGRSSCSKTVFILVFRKIIRWIHCYQKPGLNCSPLSKSATLSWIDSLPRIKCKLNFIVLQNYYITNFKDGGAKKNQFLSQDLATLCFFLTGDRGY